MPELARLAGLLRVTRPAAVLEIGSFRGGTLSLWCKLARRDAVVVAVDLPVQYGTPTDEARLGGVARSGQRLVVILRDSHEDATRVEVERALAGRPLDFLMIDGDHSYDGVRRDFELFAPLVRTGGLIAFHDVIPHPGFPGIEVDQFWSELRPQYEHEEILLPEHDIGFGPWGGIGVIRIPV